MGLENRGICGNYLPSLDEMIATVVFSSKIYFVIPNDINRPGQSLVKPASYNESGSEEVNYKFIMD